jgi:hypothetical protein
MIAYSIVNAPLAKITKTFDKSPTARRQHYYKNDFYFKHTQYGKCVHKKNHLIMALRCHRDSLHDRRQSLQPASQRQSTALPHWGLFLCSFLG